MAEPAPHRYAEGEDSHRRRRRSRALKTPRNTRARLRMAYFGIASIWGFVIGSAAILGSLSFMDLTFRPEPETFLILGVAVLMAVAGGLVTARAYRDASSRRR